MAKIKFTKGELKKQKDSLKRFERYLPILQLKKQQIQLEIQRAHERLNIKIREIGDLENKINEWAKLLREPGDHVSRWIKPDEIIIGTLNIAGLDIPVFERIEFNKAEYDLFSTPLWVDAAIDTLRKFVTLLEEKRVLKTQIRFLQEELRIVNQRVNLFERVKIPECKENVRLIRIYLGDQETNAVGRSKIAKKKSIAAQAVDIAA